MTQPPSSAHISPHRYSVEAITGERRSQSGGVEYCTRWQGPPGPADSTWEPAITLEDCAALDVYLAGVGLVDAPGWAPDQVGAAATGCQTQPSHGLDHPIKDQNTPEPREAIVGTLRFDFGPAVGLGQHYGSTRVALGWHLGSARVVLEQCWE